MGLRTGRAAAVIALTAASLTLPAPSFAGASSFVRLVNRDRAKHGLGALAVRSDLAAEARAHSVRMARAGRIFHDEAMGSRLCCWKRFGQNVGFGSGTSEIHDLFMRSASHRANILGRFDQIGVGIAWRGDVLYVTEVFVLRSAPVVRARAPAPKPQPVVRPPKPRRRQRPPAPQSVSMLLQLVALDADPGEDEPEPRRGPS